MNPDEMGQLLDELGKRLGPAGEHVWSLAVQWQSVMGLIGLIAGLLILIAVPVFLRIVWRVTRDSYDKDARVFASMVAVLVVVAGSIIVIDSAARVAMPEYAAIRDFLGAAR